MVDRNNEGRDWEIRDFSRQILAGVTGTLFAISDGMTYGWTSPMIPYLISPESHIKTTKKVAEWLETALLCGSLSGLPLTIYSVDRFGRKKSLLFASLSIIIAWILIAFGNSMTYLFIGRFVAGMAGDMSYIACPMYMAEISDKRIRGFLSGIVYIMVHIGILLVYCIGPYAPFYVMPLIGSVIVAIQLVTFYFMPESPYYLISKNKKQKAGQALEFFKPYRNIDDEINEISTMLAKQKEDRGRLQDLFMVKSNRKAIKILAVLNSGQHLCGYIAILMNLHLIMKSAGSVFLDSSYTAIIYAALMLVAAGFTIIQVDNYGRKPLLMISSVGSGLCILTLAVYLHLKARDIDVTVFSWIPVAAVMLYACFFKSGVGIIPIIVTAEIFPNNMKAIGMTLADALYILYGIISIQIYQVLIRFFDLFVPFYFFGFYAFFITYFTFYYIPETKGKSLDEIQSILKGENKLKEENKLNGESLLKEESILIGECTLLKKEHEAEETC